MVSRNVHPLAAPTKFQLPAAAVVHHVQPAAAGSPRVAIELSTNATALYVWLSTAEHGRFSRNALLLLPDAPVTVHFESWVAAGTSSAALSASLRVEHLQQYL